MLSPCLETHAKNWPNAQSSSYWIAAKCKILLSEAVESSLMMSGAAAFSPNERDSSRLEALRPALSWSVGYWHEVSHGTPRDVADAAGRGCCRDLPQHRLRGCTQGAASRRCPRGSRSGTRHVGSLACVTSRVTSRCVCQAAGVM